MHWRPLRVLIVALLLAAGMSYYYFALLIPHVRGVRAQQQLGGGYYFGGDFYPIWWTTLQLIAHRQDPYTSETTREIQTGLFGRTLDRRLPGDPPTSYHAFSYPLYLDLLAVPLAGFPFPAARLALSFVLPLAIGLAVWLWLRAFGPPIRNAFLAAVVILALVSYPALEAMFLEQASIAVAILLAAMSWALTRSKLALAGTLLALAWIKPHLAVLPTVWLLVWAASDWARRRWLLLSFAFTSGALLAASELVLPGWLPAWLAALIEYRRYTEPPLVWLVPGHWVGTPAAILLLLLAIVVGLSARRRPATDPGFHFALAFLLGVTVLTLPSGNAVYDQLLMLPAAVWLGAHGRAPQARHTPSVLLVALAGLMVLWPPTAATLVSIASWLKPALRHDVGALMLPLRTAASFPFVLLAALFLNRDRRVALYPDATVRTGGTLPPQPLLDTSRRKSRFFAMAALPLAAAMGFYHLGIFVPSLLAERVRKGLGGGYSAGNDFYPIWLTTREWFLHSRDPYSFEMTRAIQSGLFGRPLEPARPTDPPPDYRTFSYPVYVDLLAAPLATLPFPAVRWGLAFVLPVLAGASLLLWLRFLEFRPDGWLLGSFIALTLCSFPVLEGLYAEQAGLVAAFLLAGSMAALRTGRLALAGCLLGLSVIKPQMGILLIFCLLVWAGSQWQTRQRLAVACVGVMALLLACSTIVWGNWVPKWLAAVRSYRHYGTPPLVSDLLGPHLGPAAVAMLFAGTAWLAWRLRSEPVNSAAFAVGLSTILAVTSIALLPGHALYDRVILLPGIFLAVEYQHELRGARPLLRLLLLVGALALFWQWIFALVVVLARVFLASAYWNNVWFLELPIRTVGTVPFPVLGLLILIWRDLRRGRLKLEPATPARWD